MRIVVLRSICMLIGLQVLPLSAAPNYVQMTQAYRECSITIFHEVLAVLQMDVAALARRSGTHEDQLHRYLRGEELLPEFDLDMIEITFNDTKEIVHRFFAEDPFTINIKARHLLYSGDEANFDQLRKYLQIETTAQELQANGNELTEEQAQLVAKVNTVRDDALARLKHAVHSNRISYYDREQKTSTQLLAEILSRLKLTIPELAQHAGIDTAAIIAHQEGRKILPPEDVQAIYKALYAAIPDHPKPSVGKRLRAFVRQDQEERRVMDNLSGYLHRLTQDFDHAVRVERYYRDLRQLQAEQTSKDAEDSQ